LKSKYISSPGLSIVKNY